MVSVFFVTMYVQNLMCFFVFFLNFPRKKLFLARFLPTAALAALALNQFRNLFASESFLVFFYFFVEFGLFMALFHFCYEVSWEQALYSASAGRATQHLINSLLQLIRLKTDGLLMPMPEGPLWSLAWSLLSYLPFCVLIYFVFSRKMDTSHYEKGEVRRQMSLVSVVILFVCIGITRFAKNVGSWDQNAFIAQNLYAITCCLLCLIMQFELSKRAKLTQEMKMVRMLWKEDTKQIAERRDAIELINMKCHDIRHRLEDYHLPLSDREVDELKSLIRIYDQSYRTGNQTLDVLLADRALLCEKKHIQFSFLGDGGCLCFLTEAEVYSLFGNALGNAVEASCLVEEEKRQISVIIRSSGELVSINVTNYYQGPLEFEDGLPVTTQSGPRELHGYGMKSMRAVAQKYGGDLKVKAENGVFSLTIWLVSNGKPEESSGVCSV